MHKTQILPAVALLICHAPWCGAAPKPAQPKPAQAKAAPPKPRLIHEVLGTEPLSGYEGHLGETFTIGKQSPLNFTLTKCNYSVSRVNIGDMPFFPKGDEKMLVLHFTVQNPTKSPFNFNSNYLLFSAVDSGGVTRNSVSNIAREITAEPVQIALNPGQKIEAYTAIPVAAFGAVPKLIVRSACETKAPIVRYDTRAIVGKLAAPFADASDKSGATALKTVPATQGAWYPVTDYFDAKLEKVEDAVTLSGREAGAGKKNVVATFSLRNSSKRAASLSQSYFRADLKDEGGEKTNYNTSMLKGSRDEEVSTQLAPGEEVRVRFYWALPEKVAAQSVLLQYGYDRESRVFVFPAGG